MGRDQIARHDGTDAGGRTGIDQVAGLQCDLPGQLRDHFWDIPDHLANVAALTLDPVDGKRDRAMLEMSGIAHLRDRPYICGEVYSLGDINGFNLGYALPLSQPERCNDQKTPHIMEWLRTIYERPATRATWAKGRTAMAARVAMLERAPGASAPGGPHA